MTIPVHFASMNWTDHERVDPGETDVADLVLSRLSSLNGTTTWAFGFWPLPEVASVGKPDKAAAAEYMQSAGSASRMTLEVRWFEDDDVARQYVIGREGGVENGPPSEEVPWGMNGHVVKAHAHEVFTAAQAAPVYAAYFETGTVPAGYTLRYLDLSVDPAV